MDSRPVDLPDGSHCPAALADDSPREACGVAAIYLKRGRQEVVRHLRSMLLKLQNRGQLSAGVTSYNPQRNQLIDTHKELGSVSARVSRSPTRSR